MNLAQLQTLVWSWLDDVNGAYFTQPQVDVWLNNAQKETQKQLIQAGENYYLERLSGTIINGQDTYVLPADFKKCHKFEVVLSNVGTVNEQRRTCDWVTYQQLDAVCQQTGTPGVYNIRRNLITLRPIPDNTYTVYLSQSYAVVDMVNQTDIPDVPEDYHEYLAVLATFDGLLKDQRDASTFLQGKRDAYLSLLKQDAKNRDVSKPRMVVMTEMDGAGFCF